MAPEQYQGRPVDPRADLFSVGVVAFQLLTHELPFAGERPAERQAAAAEGHLRMASSLRPDVSAELDAWIAQALLPRPEDRFQSARAMLVALEQLRSEGLAIATSDDLAEAVQRVQALERDAPKPVIALGATARMRMPRSAS